MVTRWHESSLQILRECHPDKEARGGEERKTYCL